MANLKDAVTELGTARAEVQEVVLFGSAAAGTAVPGSDADVLIIISDSPERPIDRPVSYRPFFDSIGVGADLFVVTREEMERAPAAVQARKTGKTLYVKASRD